MKKIGILTRDCAGVNAAIRSIVRTASFYKIEVLGILRGYEGLINNEMMILDRRSVSGIINIGGTILKTSRSDRFYKKKWQDQAVKNIKENNIDGLIVIGGNGSLTAAYELTTKYDISVIGIPATIDNDVNGVDNSLGSDTAVNVALDALDKIRDTATSLERIFIVEVMGRNCGYIALNVALSGGCEEVIVPEKNININLICNEIKEGYKKGKVSWIIIVAEGKAKAQDIAEIITYKTGFETRIAVLGHIQRGGRPTFTDRLLAAKLGNYAVQLLIKGIKNQCVLLKGNTPTSISLNTAIQQKNIDVDTYYKLIKILS